MKKIYALLTLGLLTVVPLVIPAIAQDQTSSSPAKKQSLSPDEVVDTMAAKLNLSDEQKGKLKPIIEDRQQKLQTLRSDTSSRPMQKLRKMKGVLDESDKKIEAVLTDEQKKQYSQMKDQMREQMKQRM
ncbi:MAG TPA: hypothetical protein VK638_18730, partial [Edaphobacter sp.]|nr:hypothetical protein [Edaphobacter sp.]